MKHNLCSRALALMQDIIDILLSLLSWWTGRDSQNYTYWHGEKGINETGCACASDDSCVR